MEKLSDRLVKLFLSHVKEYDTRCFNPPTICFEGWDRVSPMWFAERMKKHIMDMIAEHATEECMEMIAAYEPEDIE